MTSASAQPVRAIDIHHHYTPPELLEEATKHGESLGVEVGRNTRGQTVLAFLATHLLGEPWQRPDLL